MMGDYDYALSMYKGIVQRHPNRAEIYYAIASVYARQGKIAPAFSWLRRAVEKGYDERERIETDPNLANLRNTDLYQTFIEGLQ
jgi:tetratricopeptide (TPR) repeat protein